ncbi:hypothetical protein D3C81_806790 [compost metagenome]
MGMPNAPPISLNSPTGTNSLVLNTKAARASAMTLNQRWRSLGSAGITATGDVVSTGQAEQGALAGEDIVQDGCGRKDRESGTIFACCDAT